MMNTFLSCIACADAHGDQSNTLAATFASVDMGVVKRMTKDFHAWLAESRDESSVRINHLIRMVAIYHNCGTSAATCGRICISRLGRCEWDDERLSCMAC